MADQPKKPNRPEPYVQKDPNDIIRSGDWNELQTRTREEIQVHKHTGGADGAKIPLNGIDDGAIIIKNVLVKDGEDRDIPLYNGDELKIADWAKGIKIKFEVNDKQYFNPDKHNCYVTIEMPFPKVFFGMMVSVENILGYLPLILAADVTSNQGDIYLYPNHNNLLETKIRNRLPARLTLRGNFIDGRNPSQKKENVDNPKDANNSARRRGDFEMWFWLMPIHPFIKKWGKEGAEDGEFNSLSGIAVDGNGYVYVADSNSHRIQKFDSDGKFITKWGASGSGDGEFNSPSGIAVDGNGYVYVADRYNERIQKFDSKGKFIMKWGENGTGDGEFNSPLGIAVDGNGNVYVAEIGNNRIQKFDSDGGFITKWGKEGTEDGEFNYPSGIAVDENGNVYVADTNNNRIQKFDSDGEFTAKWEGTRGGKFRSPKRITVDGSGNVYVVDRYLQKITISGQFLLKFRVGQPKDIAIDGTGNIYMIENEAILKLGQ